MALLYEFDFLTNPAFPAQDLNYSRPQISPLPENLLPPSTQYKTSQYFGQLYSYVSTSGAYAGTGVHPRVTGTPNNENPYVIFRREEPLDSVSNYEGTFTVRGYSGAYSDNEVGFSFQSSTGDARFFWHAKTGVIRIYVQPVLLGPIFSASGSVPSPDVGGFNKVSWSYNASSKRFTMSTSYDQISVVAPGFAITPVIWNGSAFPVWFPAVLYFNGLADVPAWEQEIRWVHYTSQYGADEWILRHFPRDDELGMSLNGLGRVNSAAATSHPTSQQRSQRVGRTPGAGYL